MKKNICAISLGLFLANPPAAMADDSLHLTGTFGVNYSDGNFGTDKDTNVLLDLPTLSAEIGNFQFSASMPYMRISGRGLVVFDAVGNPVVINRNPLLPPDVRRGFGDLNLGVTYSIPPEVLNGWKVSVTERVKAPVASGRKRLSTGAVDYGTS